MSDDKKQPDRRYDAWLFWNVIQKCNLSCNYCFGNLRNKAGKKEGIPPGRIKGFLPAARAKAERIIRLGIPGVSKRLISKFVARSGKTAAINIDALIKTLDKTNKTFRIGISGGGEPFLVPNLTKACAEITKKHYISINTNLTSAGIRKFSEVIAPERVLSICASLHIKELERLNLVERYISNFNILKEKGFRIFTSEVAYPPFLSEVPKYREYFRKRGIRLSFAKFSGPYNGREYPDSYTREELEIFGLEKQADLALFHSTDRICNAGYNAVIALPSGNVKLCYEIGEDMGHVYKEIRFKPGLTKCPVKYCVCPLRYHDPYLFERALAENGYAADEVY
ncbi:MAG: hypothetical protein HY589_01135 [Candidatus Omnitrophica bacterium]|nr:hypothetical protein [Candidatus Omnitrophota bacterium]